MRLTFDIERFDGRGIRSVPVIDEDTDQTVGTVFSHGTGMDRSGGIRVSLFGGKYSILVQKKDEAWGFVKGVEEVLKQVSYLLAHDTKKKQVSAA